MEAKDSELTIEKRLELLEAAFDGFFMIREMNKNTGIERAKIRNWFVAYKKRTLTNMVAIIEDDLGHSWQDLRDGKIQEIVQRCAYHKCNHTRTVKTKDLEGMTDEDLVFEETLWSCCKACADRATAWDHLFIEYRRFEAGEITLEEWDKMVKKADTAHLRKEERDHEANGTSRI